MPQHGIDQLRVRRARGYILSLIYEERPAPLEAENIRIVLDGMNLSDTQQDIARHLDYLRSEGLIYCFNPGDGELSKVDAAKLVQRYTKGLENKMVCRLTAKGVRWIEREDDSEVAVARL